MGSQSLGCVSAQHARVSDTHLHTCMRHIYSTHTLMGIRGGGDGGYTVGGGMVIWIIGS